MLRHTSAIFFLLSSLTSLSFQVDIHMAWAYYRRDDMSLDDHKFLRATWPNVPPGTCCIPDRSALPFLGYMTDSVLRVTGLQMQQFAAGWAATGQYHGDIVHCTGAPVDRFYGPGQWLRHFPVDSSDEEGYGSHVPHAQDFIMAAIWIDLRTRFPASGKESRYLALQSVKRLILGKDVWSAASDGVPLTRRKTVRRGTVNGNLNEWAEQGTAYIGAPVRWMYPVRYEVNGTNYTRGEDGNYKSEQGVKLAKGG